MTGRQTTILLLILVAALNIINESAGVGTLLVVFLRQTTEKAIQAFAISSKDRVCTPHFLGVQNTKRVKVQDRNNTGRKNLDF